MATVQKICRITGASFEITDAEQEHLKRMGELLPEVKGHGFPLPTVHPLETLRLLASMVNLFHLYQGKSSLSGKPMLTVCAPGLGLNPVTTEEFWSDTLDNRVHGLDYDFSKPFFQQWYELRNRCYVLPLSKSDSETSEYVSGAKAAVNSYLSFVIMNSEECLYCYDVTKANHCIDCVGTYFSENCYDCRDVENCYQCQHLSDSKNCSFCIACVDCTGCTNCFGCVGLSHKEYCIFNEQKTKEEYETFIKEQKLGDRVFREQALKKCFDFIEGQNHVVNRVVNCENCTGDYLTNCQNVYEGYFSKNAVDCGNIALGINAKNAWRGVPVMSEFNYYSAGVGSNHSYANTNGRDSPNCIYSYQLMNGCTHCFGCISLKKQSYCILNKQYTKEEYFELVPRIIEHMKSTGEWGEYFPAYTMPAYFEETAAVDWMKPISKEEAVRRGYTLKPVEKDIMKDELLSTDTIPTHINDVDPTQVLGKVYACKESGAKLTYQAKEIAFYKKYNIPLPLEHWKVRMKKRIHQRELVPTV